MAKKKKSNSIVGIVATILGVLLVGGIAGRLFISGGSGGGGGTATERPTSSSYKIAPVEYNPTFGETFKDTYSLAALDKEDNISVAPYAYRDTTLFSGKKITKIDAPVGRVTAVNDQQFFTLFVIKSSVVTVDGVYTSQPYQEYKIYIPREELTSTTVNKWISIDVSALNIFVGDDETLAFMKNGDTVYCRYKTDTTYPFYYGLNNAGKLQRKESIFYGIYTDTPVNLNGKNLSILGDSISTYGGVSNDATNANSTIGSNAVYYPRSNYSVDNVSETWWKQAVDLTGMNLLVNNSWSGSRVLNTTGIAYQGRCENLHDNTGDNAGTNPDIIAVYIGINDFDNHNECGAFGTLADIYKKDTGYIVPQNFAEAYAIMIHKMITKYNHADVFIFTLPPNHTNRDNATLAKYNEQIKKIANYFKCYIVDIGNIEGYDIQTYTEEGLHPNEKGMDLITDIFIRTLKGVYAKKK